MTEQKINAQVLNGVNVNIPELKSLSTTRKRVFSVGDFVSKWATGFQFAYGNTRREAK